MKHGSCILQTNEDYCLENKSITTAIDLEQAEDIEERRCEDGK